MQDDAEISGNNPETSGNEDTGPEEGQQSLTTTPTQGQPGVLPSTGEGLPVATPELSPSNPEYLKQVASQGIPNPDAVPPALAQLSPTAYLAGKAIQSSLAGGAINNAYPAVIMGINKGAEDFGVKGLASLRSLTDHFGLTSPEVTQQALAWNQERQGVYQDAIDQSSNPTIGNAASFIAKNAPYAALGGAAGGSSLLRMVAGNAVGGAVQGFMGGGGKDLGENLTNAGLGAAIGGIGTPALMGASKVIGKGLELVGGLVREAKAAATGVPSLANEAFKIDPGKAEVFKQLGSAIPGFANTARPSQLAADPGVARNWLGLEKTLAGSALGFNMKGQMGKQMDMIQDNFPRIIKELDTGPVSAHDLYAASVDNPAVNDKLFSPVSVPVAAKEALKEISKAGKDIDAPLTSHLQEIAQGKPGSLSDFENSRRTLDQYLYNLHDPSNNAAMLQFKAGLQARNVMDAAVKKIANTQGVLPQYLAAQAASKTEKVVQSAKDAYEMSLAPGAYARESQGATINPDALTKNLNRNMGRLSDLNYPIPADHGENMSNAFKMINAIQTIGNMNLNKGAIKSGDVIGSNTVSDMASKVASPIKSVMASMPAAFHLMNKGAGSMITTPTGIDMIAKMGAHGFVKDTLANGELPAKMIPDHVKAALLTALGVGIMDAHRNPDLASSHLPSTYGPSLSTDTPEHLQYLQAVASQGLAPPPPQQVEQQMPDAVAAVKAQNASQMQSKSVAPSQ